jgi:hypothetical protein
MVPSEVRTEDHGRSFSERSMMLVDIIPKNAFGPLWKTFLVGRFQSIRRSTETADETQIIYRDNMRGIYREDHLQAAH